MQNVGPLSHEQILALHKATLSARLVANRTGLLVGLPTALVTGLPLTASPSEQVLIDLDVLNTTVLSDGTSPLAIWLKNAIALAEARQETIIFEQVLAQLQAAKNSSAPQASGRPSHEVVASQAFEYIAAALKEIGAARETAKAFGINAQLNSKTPKSFQGVEELADAVFAGAVGERDTVIVEGVLSRYAPFYVPRAFPRLLPAEALFPSSPPAQMQVTFRLTSGLPVSTHIPARSAKIAYHPSIHKKPPAGIQPELTLRAPFLPIGTLPPLRFGSDERTHSWRVCFLYPSRATGLLVLPPLSGPGSNYFVPPENRGIPILVPSFLDLSSAFESVCRLQAVVRKSPERVLDLLSGMPIELRREMASNFYRPELPRTRGFVLELSQSTPPTNVSGAATGFAGTIFLESHIEGIAFEDVSDLFQEYFLENFPLLQEEIRNGWSPAVVSFDGVSAVGLPGAIVVAKKPNYYAIYSTVDLRSGSEYASSYRYLRRTVDDFSHAVNALAHGMRARNGIVLPELKFCHDFLFDYECQYDFDVRGVLDSAEAARAVARQPALSETAEWLRLRRQ